MNRDPRNCREYEELISFFCSDCVFAGVPCDRCPFGIIRVRPRQVVIQFDYSFCIADIIKIAEEMASRSAFTVTEVRAKYKAAGNASRLNWGAVTRSKEWREKFIKIGDVVSRNERSHGDTVKIWARKPS